MNIEREKFLSPDKEQKRFPSFGETFPAPDEYLKTMESGGFSEHAKSYEKVLAVAEEVGKEGGEALLVGGSVRDFLMGIISKDFDIEVYGLRAEKIESIVGKIGRVSEVGRAFGILKIMPEDGPDIDVSLPRVDSKTGAGHGGFDVKTDPFMKKEDAARRRDFTINSMAANPLTGEIYDYFGGVEDIRNRVLRVTDAERFRDDPLRVLRALQFIGRFGLEIDKESANIMGGMLPLLNELPKERLGEEWKKLLLKSDKPSLGLSAGMAIGVFGEIHPEFSLLAETEQDLEWHPEGDVWIHTMMTVDEAAKIIRRENLDGDKALTVMLSSLCHDLGKPMVTEYADGHIRSRGHEQAGEEPTKKFLTSIGTSNLIRDKVVKLVTNHLIPTMFYVDEIVRGNKISDGAIRRLAQRIHPATIRELILVSEADHLGRGSFSSEIKEQMMLPADRFSAGEWLLKRARELAVESSCPENLTRGRDWVLLGCEPGPKIGEMIRLSNSLRDEKGFSREMVFKALDGVNDGETAVKVLESALKSN